MSFEQAFNNIVKAAAINKIMAESDYIGDDGFIYCGKCNTPRECKVIIHGRGERVVGCLCKCRTEQRDRKAAEAKAKERENKIKEKRRIGFPDQELMKMTFANDDLTNPRITKAMQRYVEHFPEMKKSGQGLLLFGVVGTGKTFAAAEVANALIDRGYTALVTNFARIANTVGGMFEGKQQYYDSLNRFDLLVLDDLATERKTEYMQEIVYNVIDSRYRAGLPMIITTNLTAEELKKPQDIVNKRIYDRILEKCLPIEVEGVNRRHKKTAEKYGDLKDLLGL